MYTAAEYIVWSESVGYSAISTPQLSKQSYKTTLYRCGCIQGCHKRLIIQLRSAYGWRTNRFWPHGTMLCSALLVRRLFCCTSHEMFWFVLHCPARLRLCGDGYCIFLFFFGLIFFIHDTLFSTILLYIRCRLLLFGVMIAVSTIIFSIRKLIIERDDGVLEHLAHHARKCWILN